MGQRQQIVETALSQLGYTEGSNNDTKYGDWYGMNNQPWCMMFVSWCAAQADVGEDIIPRQSYCPTAVEWFKNKGQFKAAGAVPQPGDIIFFDENRNGVADHTGLVVESGDGYLVAVEGNRQDNVAKYRYAIDYVGILGYGCPKYQGEEKIMIKVKHLDQNKVLTLEGFYQDGHNYILLRDAEKLAPLVVDWDEQERIATVKANYRQQD